MVILHDIIIHLKTHFIRQDNLLFETTMTALELDECKLRFGIIRIIRTNRDFSV